MHICTADTYVIYTHTHTHTHKSLMGACSESKSFIFTAAAYESLLLKLCTRAEEGRKGGERARGTVIKRKKVLKCFYKQAQRENDGKEKMSIIKE